LENRELLRIAAKASRISWVVQTLAATHDGQRMIGVTLAGIRQVKIESNLQGRAHPGDFVVERGVRSFRGCCRKISRTASMLGNMRQALFGNGRHTFAISCSDSLKTSPLYSLPRVAGGRVNTANLREHGGNFNGHCWTLRRLRATSEILGICSIAHFPPR
jgi:hypothetical protein